MHPSQFQVNEAWIVFQLNDAPIRTAQDGSFNCVCLMDAASCFILGSALVPVDESEPSTMQIRELLEAGWTHKQELPKKLLVPTGQFQTQLPAEAERQKIAILRAREGKLTPFIREARQAFKEYQTSRRDVYN